MRLSKNDMYPIFMFSSHKNCKSYICVLLPLMGIQSHFFFAFAFAFVVLVCNLDNHHQDMIPCNAAGKVTARFLPMVFVLNLAGFGSVQRSSKSNISPMVFAYMYGCVDVSGDREMSFQTSAQTWNPDCHALQDTHKCV